MKKIKKLIAITLFASFLLGMTVSAAPIPVQTATESEDVPSLEVHDNEVIPDKNLISPFALVHTPCMNIYSITVAPIYYINSINDPTWYYGLKSYTVYQPTIASPYGLTMQITASQKAAMEKAVTDAGYTLVGYHYEVTIQADTSLQYRRFEFSSPSGLGTYRMGGTEPGFIVAVNNYSSDPDLELIGAYYYIKDGKQLSAMFSATARFPK